MAGVQIPVLSPVIRMSRVNMINEHQFCLWAQKNNPSPAMMITAREGGKNHDLRYLGV